MLYEYCRPESEQALLAARDTNSLEKALGEVADLHPVITSPEVFGRQMFCRELDATIPILARRLGLTDIPLPKSNDNVLIVGTAFHSHGGHSRVAEDISRLIGADRTTVALTDIYRERNHLMLLHAPADAPLKRRATILLGAPTLVGKIVELYNLVAALRPTRIFLLNHHFDMVAPIALWPFREVVEFLHHVDHVPGVGATLPWTHVDLTWRCHRACQEVGLAPVFAGLTVQDGLEPRAESRASTPGRLRIATCGHSGKYKGAGLNRWTDYVLAALGLEGAEILHIGPTNEQLSADISQALAGASIDPARYRYLGITPSLSATLFAEDVDVYLSSYPTSGGKAIVEAMSVGIPTIVPLDDSAPPLIQFDFPVPAWIRVGTPEDLGRVLESLRHQPAPRSPAVQNELSAELMRFNRYVLDGAARPATG